MKSYSGSIQKKLLTLIISIVLVSGSVGYITFFIWQINKQEESSLQSAYTISHVIGQDIAKILIFNDISIAVDVNKKLKSFKNLESLIIYKKDGTAFFEYFKDTQIQKIPPFDKKLLGKNILHKGTFQIATELKYQKNFIAYAQYTIHVKTLQQILIENLLPFLLLLIIVIFIVVLLSIKFAKNFTQPIIKLVEFLDNIQNETSLDKRISITQDNEFGKLYNEVNIMLERMEDSYKDLEIAAVAFDTENAMIITDAKSKILQVNRAFSEMTLFDEEYAIGKKPAILKSAKQSDEFYLSMYRELEIYHYFSQEIINKKKDGTFFTAQLLIQCVLDENDEIIYYIGSLSDITRQKRTQEKLDFLQRYDALTGLINRKQFVDELQIALDMQKESETVICIALDVENFKYINEAYGFELANKLLKYLALRLKGSCKDAKLLARMGADEFILSFIIASKDMRSIEVQAQILAHKILDIISSKPFAIDSKQINISVHLGISIFSTQAQQRANHLIKEATSAINIAKTDAISFSFYNIDYQKLSEKHIDLYSKLSLAIEKNQFELYYQLQNNENAEIIGAEALIRWIDPERGVLAPFEFIDLLETSDLILKLTPWIADTACKQLALWQDSEKTKDWTLSINASSKEFNDSNFVTHIKESVEKYNIQEGLFKIELLESNLLTDRDAVIEKMYQLRALGVMISLDDFGTGYSSLSYLQYLPIQQIKIDKTFIKNIKSNIQNIAIVKGILLLREPFGVSVIAEGVKTEEDFEYLKSLGCTMYQGYYFAKPKPIGEIDFMGNKI